VTGAINQEWRTAMSVQETPNADQFEITPEMIEAGVDELWKFEHGWGDPDLAVKQIVQAVLGARRTTAR